MIIQLILNLLYKTFLMLTQTVILGKFVDFKDQN